MRYPMPNFPCYFEIPDDWLAETGLVGFTPSSEAYRSTAGAMLIPLRHIEPPFRSPGCPKDFRGFDRARLLSVLNGIAAGAEIEPVPLLILPRPDYSLAPFPYRVLDGFHRFYASIVAGFECVPAFPRECCQ